MRIKFDVVRHFIINLFWVTAALSASLYGIRYMMSLKPTVAVNTKVIPVVHALDDEATILYLSDGGFCTDLDVGVGND